MSPEMTKQVQARVIALLNSLNAQYKIVDSTGQLVIDTFPPEPVKVPRARLFNWSAITGYQDLVLKATPGTLIVFCRADFEQMESASNWNNFKSSLSGYIKSHWGEGKYMRVSTATEIEFLREV